MAFYSTEVPDVTTAATVTWQNSPNRLLLDKEVSNVQKDISESQSEPVDMETSASLMALMRSNTNETNKSFVSHYNSFPDVADVPSRPLIARVADSEQGNSQTEARGFQSSPNSYHIEKSDVTHVVSQRKRKRSTENIDNRTGLATVGGQNETSHTMPAVTSASEGAKLLELIMQLENAYCARNRSQAAEARASFQAGRTSTTNSPNTTHIPPQTGEKYGVGTPAVESTLKSARTLELSATTATKGVRNDDNASRILMAAITAVGQQVMSVLNSSTVGTAAISSISSITTITNRNSNDLIENALPTCNTTVTVTNQLNLHPDNTAGISSVAAAEQEYLDVDEFLSSGALAFDILDAMERQVEAERLLTSQIAVTSSNVVNSRDGNIAIATETNEMKLSPTTMAIDTIVNNPSSTSVVPTATETEKPTTVLVPTTPYSNTNHGNTLLAHLAEINAMDGAGVEANTSSPVNRDAQITSNVANAALALMLRTARESSPRVDSNSIHPCNLNVTETRVVATPGIRNGRQSEAITTRDITTVAASTALIKECVPSQLPFTTGSTALMDIDNDDEFDYATLGAIEAAAMEQCAHRQTERDMVTNPSPRFVNRVGDGTTVPSQFVSTPLDDLAIPPLIAITDAIATDNAATMGMITTNAVTTIDTPAMVTTVAMKKNDDVEIIDVDADSLLGTPLDFETLDAALAAALDSRSSKPAVDGIASTSSIPPPTWRLSARISQSDALRMLGTLAFPLPFSPSVSADAQTATAASVSVGVPVFLRALVMSVSSTFVNAYGSAVVLLRLAYLTPSCTLAGPDSTAHLAHAYVTVHSPFLDDVMEDVAAGSLIHLIAVRNGVPVRLLDISSATTSSNMQQQIGSTSMEESLKSGCDDVVMNDKRFHALEASCCDRKQLSQLLPSSLLPLESFTVPTSGGRSCSVCQNELHWIIPLTEANNMLILHPDLLLPPTKIAGVSTCLRRTVLQDLLSDAGASSESSRIPLFGQLKHELFQAALAAAEKTVAHFTQAITSSGGTSYEPFKHEEAQLQLSAALIAHAAAIVHDPLRMEDLYAAGEADDAALRELTGIVPGIVHWISTYVWHPARFLAAIRTITAQPPVPSALESVSSSSTISPHVLPASPSLFVSHLVATEDEIWSPVWGLKGIVDATLDICIAAPPATSAAAHNASSLNNNWEQWHWRRVPFELKTGKRPSEGSFIEHRAQVALYALLMNERYGFTTSSPLEHASADAQSTSSAVSLPTKLVRGLPRRTSSTTRSVDTAKSHFDLGAFGRSGDVSDVGGLLIYLASPDDQRAATTQMGNTNSSNHLAAQLATMHYTSLLPTPWPEQRSLLLQRNRLAAALTRARAASSNAITKSTKTSTSSRREISTPSPIADAASIPSSTLIHSPPQLPPLLQDERMCSRCFAFPSCAAVYTCFELPAAEHASAQARRVESTSLEYDATNIQSSAMIPLLDDLPPNLRKLYSAAGAHLTPAHKAYVHRWMQLIDVESAELRARFNGATRMVQSAGDIEDVIAAPVSAPRLSFAAFHKQLDGRAALWAQDSRVREKHQGGVCAAMTLIAIHRFERENARLSATLLPDAEVEIVNAGDDADAVNNDSFSGRITHDDTFLYVFVRTKATPSLPQAEEEGVDTFLDSFIEMDVGIGDFIVVSRDVDEVTPGKRIQQTAALGPFAVLRGYILCKGPHHITLGASRDIRLAYGNTIVATPEATSLMRTNTTKQGTCSCGNHCDAAVSAFVSSSLPRKNVSSATPPWHWRLDRHESDVTNRIELDNLVRLLMGQASLGGDNGCWTADTDNDCNSTTNHAGANENEPGVVLIDGNENGSEMLPNETNVPDIVEALVVATVRTDTKAKIGDWKRRLLLIDNVPPQFHHSPLFPWSGDAADITLASSPSINAFGASVFAAQSIVRRSIRDQQLWVRTPPDAPSAQALKLDFYRSPNNTCVALNDDQRAVISRVLCAKDYVCVLGMPGTGKTSTIAFLVRCCVALGRSVLITSYTHTAVDTLLLKLLQSTETGANRARNRNVTPATTFSLSPATASIATSRIDILRIGAEAKVHPLLAPFTLEHGIRSGKLSSISAIAARLRNAQVVGATCLATRHPIFARRAFDICIVDEASQLKETVCIGPLRAASTFVLVGDQSQLPPLVHSRQAKAGGLDVSLFQRLCDTHPTGVSALTVQYRMNTDIQSIANALVYNGRLQCGNDFIATGQYKLRNDARLRQVYPSSVSSTMSHDVNWLPHVLAPTTTVLFFDIDRAMEEQSMQVQQQQEIRNEPGSSLHPLALAKEGTPSNAVEADIIAIIASGILLAGGKLQDVGVISPFRAQLRFIRNTLTDLLVHKLGVSTTEASQLEVETVDRYQGRDKPVLLVSFARYSLDGDVGALLTDLRRLNVAVTRAKYKLIIIGSRKTLRAAAATVTTAVANDAVSPGSDASSTCDASRPSDIRSVHRGATALGELVRIVEDKGWVITPPLHTLRKDYYSFPSLATGCDKDTILDSPKSRSKSDVPLQNPSNVINCTTAVATFTEQQNVENDENDDWMLIGDEANAVEAQHMATNDATESNAEKTTSTTSADLAVRAKDVTESEPQSTEAPNNNSSGSSNVELAAVTPAAHVTSHDRVTSEFTTARGIGSVTISAAAVQRSRAIFAEIDQDTHSSLRQHIPQQQHPAQAMPPSSALTSPVIAAISAVPSVSTNNDPAPPTHITTVEHAVLAQHENNNTIANPAVDTITSLTNKTLETVLEAENRISGTLYAADQRDTHSPYHESPSLQPHTGSALQPLQQTMYSPMPANYTPNGPQSGRPKKRLGSAIRKLPRSRSNHEESPQPL